VIIIYLFLFLIEFLPKVRKHALQPPILLSTFYTFSLSPFNLMLSNFLFHFLHFMTFLQDHSLHNFDKCKILKATYVIEFLLRTHMDSYVGSHMWQSEFIGTFCPVIPVTSECPLQFSTLGNCLTDPPLYPALLSRMTRK
jgi:hypothetical protein